MHIGGYTHHIGLGLDTRSAKNDYTYPNRIKFDIILRKEMNYLGARKILFRTLKFNYVGILCTTFTLLKKTTEDKKM